MRNQVPEAHESHTSASDPLPAPRKQPAPRKRRFRARGRTNGAHVVWLGGVAQLRWPDPVTGRMRSEMTGVRSRDVALDLVKTKSAALQKEIDKLALRRAAGLPDPESEARTIEQAARAYYDRLAYAVNRSPSTLRHAEDDLGRWVEFCRARDARLLSDVNAALLAAFYAELSNSPGRRRARVAVSTVNQWLKPVRAALRQAYAGGYAPHLTDELLRLHIPHVPIASETNRELHGLDHARALERSELKPMLRKLLDAGRYRAAAIDVTLLLLYGQRRAELCRTRVCHVTRDGLRLPASACKGRRSRHVPSQGYTVLGQQLLDVLAECHAPSEWLSEGAYSTLGNVFSWLGIRGHDLRASCATYQLSLPISVKLATARLGHTLAIADQSYLQLLSEQPHEAPSLEVAMGLEAEITEVISLARERMFFPRTRRRASPNPDVKGLRLKR